MHLGRGQEKRGDTSAALASLRKSVTLWQALSGRDLPAYMPGQQGESLWRLAMLGAKLKAADAGAAANALIKLASEKPASFAKPPHADWLAEAKALSAKLK